MNSKEGPTISYLKLHINQSTHVISIYQIAHINNTTLVQWFTDATEHVNSAPNTFKADSTFELSLEEN